MEIIGQLKEDIQSGNIVFFLGAGASQAAGLYGASKLANYIFLKATEPEQYKKYKDDLINLVARLDQDKNFSRKWINKKLIDYFLDNKNYQNLETHQKLLHLNLKAIFTTNYDSCIELAEYKTKPKYRISTIADPKEEGLIINDDIGKVRYFKIHGCCNELNSHPTTSPPLVITKQDFRKSISRNAIFFHELKRLSYNSSIIFIGFNIQRSENNPILSNILEIHNNLQNSFQEPFLGHVVLMDVNEDDKFDIESAGLKLLEGSFEDFIDSCIKLQDSKNKPILFSPEDSIKIRTRNKEIFLTKGEHQQYQSQFISYHDKYINDLLQEANNFPKNKLIDLWKSATSDLILANNFYMKRSIFEKVLETLNELVKETTERRKPHILVLSGMRGCGKSVIARQLLKHAYTELMLPSLVLKNDSFIISDKDGTKITISGWDNKLIDKFLSLLVHDNLLDQKSQSIPVILADQLSHRLSALEYLINYLENHKKPCVLILTLSTYEYDELQKKETDDHFLQSFKYKQVKISHKINDKEINDLFEIIAKLRPQVIDNKSLLIDKAKKEDDCNRDILFILYSWFDKKFRKLKEILSDEISNLHKNEKIKLLYLSVAVFHQYNFSPPISICAKGSNITLEEFYHLRNEPLFKSFISITNLASFSQKEFITTRHPKFSREILKLLLPQKNDQVTVICNVLKYAEKENLQFVRDFFVYAVKYKASFSTEQIASIKKSTETNFSEDSFLNHQYGAYLVRDRTNYYDALYYLNKAQIYDPDNPAILHTIGNLHLNFYKKYINTEPKKALEHFNDARIFFERNRFLAIIQSEYPYFSEIDMLKHRIKRLDNPEISAQLKCEQSALFLEALEVVPEDKQNLLNNIINDCISFDDLSKSEREIVIRKIKSFNATPLLFEFYVRHYSKTKSQESWYFLKEIIELYWDSDIIRNNPFFAIIIAKTSKYAFIKNADSRFELLRPFFDTLVRWKDKKVSTSLMGEYIRLIQTDALALNKYEFLREVQKDITDYYSDIKPYFLKEEYLLDDKYYMFDEKNKRLLVSYFLEEINFSSKRYAKTYSSLAKIKSNLNERYFSIELDPVSHFWIRGIKLEVTQVGNVELSFFIKYTPSGFIGSDFKT